MDKSKIYTTKELAELTAGGDSYIRTKNNVVKGLAITKEKNPEAPNIITVSNKGPKIIKNAEILSATTELVKTFVKMGTNQWRYAGMYKMIRYSKSMTDILKHHGNRPVKDIYGILFMEKVENT